MKNIVINIPKEIVKSEQNWYFQRKLVQAIHYVEMEDYGIREGLRKVDSMFINRLTFSNLFFNYKKVLALMNVYYREELPDNTIRIISNADILADIHIVYGEKLSFKDFVKTEKFQKA